MTVPHHPPVTTANEDDATPTLSNVPDTTPARSRKDFLGSAAKAATGAALAGSALGATPALAAGARHLPEIMRKGSQVTLTYIVGASPAELQTRKAIVNKFMAANPDINIVFQLGGNAFQQKLNTEIAGGTPPDLIMSFELQHATYAQQGNFMNLDPFIARDSAFQHTVMPDQYPAMLNMFRYKGHLYALPEAVNNVVLYYNRDHLAEAGLTMPSSWDDRSWTWDKFLHYATALTQQRGSRVTRYGYAESWWWPLVACSVIAPANGGDWFTQPIEPPAGSSNLSDPKIARAIQFYADLTNVHKVAPDNRSLTAQAGFQLFMTGRASMGILGHWFFKDFAQTSGLNFDIAPIPIGPDGGSHSTTALGGIGLAMSAKTKYPEQCWRFIRYWTGLQGQTGFAGSGLWVPTLRSLGQSALYRTANAAAPHPTVFTDVLREGYVHSLPISSAWADFSIPWANDLIDQVWAGKQPAAQVAAALDKTINASIKKNS